MSERAAGGYARAAGLSRQRRREIARAGAAARWLGHGPRRTPEPAAVRSLRVMQWVCDDLRGDRHA